MSMPSDFEKLPTAERRLVKKFVSALTNSKIEDKERKKLIRSLRRACRCSDEKDGVSRKNAYTYYYCDRFLDVKKEQQAQGLASTVCHMAKLIAAEWKNLDPEKKSHYTKLAKASRVSSAVAV
ncbi:MAG: hypothetical protein MIO92_06000 [Methanosarcinaceae archaeon]|nr:hypothetical protein [Methanosarcinaceae archaeon]